jgi:hypothetical protein
MNKLKDRIHRVGQSAKVRVKWCLVMLCVLPWVLNDSHLLKQPNPTWPSLVRPDVNLVSHAGQEADKCNVPAEDTQQVHHRAGRSSDQPRLIIPQAESAHCEFHRLFVM